MAYEKFKFYQTKDKMHPISVTNKRNQEKEYMKKMQKLDMERVRLI